MTLFWRKFLRTAVTKRVGGRTEKAEKSRHFSILIKKAKSWKNSRNFTFWLFRAKWENSPQQYPREIQEILQIIWKKWHFFQVLYKHEWNRQKVSYFSFLLVNHKSRRCFYGILQFLDPGKSKIGGSDHWFFSGLFFVEIELNLHLMDFRVRNQDFSDFSLRREKLARMSEIEILYLKSWN